MADNAQKVALARTLNQWGQRRAAAEIQRQGRALPVQVVSVAGPIVTVKFLIANTSNSPYTLPNVTVPLAGPQYWRPPTQMGDLGVVFPVDAYVGGVSGLGGGVADLSLRANLSTLVFFPIGNKNWSVTDNPNANVIYGPDGVILRDTNKQMIQTLTAALWAVMAAGGAGFSFADGVFTFNCPVVFTQHVSGQAGGGGTVNFGDATIETTGPALVGAVTSTGDVTAGSISLEGHVHTGVQPGSGDTGPPTG